MKNISQIVDILQLEVDKDNSDKSELERLISLKELYDKIINYGNNLDIILENKESFLILLDMVDKDIALLLSKLLNNIEQYKQKKLTDLEEYKNAINCVTDLFKKLIRKNKELEDKISELIKKIESNENQISLFKIALSKIKFKQYLPYNITTFLDNFFEEKNYPIIDQIKLLEIINIYNQTVYERIHNYPQSYKNEVLDMLSFGFEIIEDDNLDYNKDVTRKVELHYSLLKYQDDFEKYFEEIQHELDNENDLKLFYILMIKKLQAQIFETISLIKMKEFYVDLDTKNEIIHEYKKLINLYLKFRNKYFDIISKEDEKVETSNIKVIFAQDKNGRPYFIKDLKNINNEYLEKMLELITSLINGTLTNKNIEGFTSLYKDFRKLKNDQIRIVFHPISSELYCIMGVGVKKDNAGNYIYKTLCGRKYPNNETEIFKLLEDSASDLEYIEQYVIENKRKGNR